MEAGAIGHHGHPVQKPVEVAVRQGLDLAIIQLLQMGARVVVDQLVIVKNAILILAQVIILKTSRLTKNIQDHILILCYGI